MMRRMVRYCLVVAVVSIVLLPTPTHATQGVRLKNVTADSLSEAERATVVSGNPTFSTSDANAEVRLVYKKQVPCLSRSGGSGSLADTGTNQVISTIVAVILVCLGVYGIVRHKKLRLLVVPLIISVGGMASTQPLSAMSPQVGANETFILRAGETITYKPVVIDCYEYIGYIKTLSSSPITPPSTPTPGTPQQPPTPPAVPGAAIGEGFTRLAFYDDFDSLDTIDSGLTGRPGFRWYPAGVHKWGKIDTQPDEYSVANSILRIDPKHRNYNHNMATRDPNTGAGQSFGHGYFEARMRWEAHPEVPKTTPDGYSWPAFWSQSYAKFDHNALPYCELDFAESQRPNEILSTMWDWQGLEKSKMVRNRHNTYTRPDLDLSQWHVYGVLWAPGMVEWYLDGQLIQAQYWTGERANNPRMNPVTAESPAQNFPLSQAFRNFDTEADMNVILGTGTGRPMDVDWVRIWQRP